jgi:hypothetical protein
MCGGTVNEKIFAAFNLFDANNSMTLTFDELFKFVKCVFLVFEQTLKTEKGDPNTIWDSMDFEKLTFATTEKCFSDNKVMKAGGEINYT